MLIIFGTKNTISYAGEKFIFNEIEYKVLYIQDISFCYFPSHYNEASVLRTFFYKYGEHRNGFVCIGGRNAGKVINPSRLLPNIKIPVKPEIQIVQKFTDMPVKDTFEIEEYRLEEIWLDGFCIINYYLLKSLGIHDTMRLLEENYLK